MEIVAVYYIAKFLLDIYKVKSHSKSEAKSGFIFNLTINKLIVKIKYKKY
ncbi:hypothetical protein O0E53_13375 [Clostridioides difficile]|nr:hypothetical protein [Clostridioides difficile]MCC0636546.1 hypothetical protein [Clostridioides sp. ES-S-0001-02]MCC0677778.1 hypothetical protein [Clostridioides sp. ES-W-0018-02]MCC0681033.1 hypothetical protein [Clostridioides sp. ES-S-0005-03]MCC0713121.1 hypothetical protein [Clostridioides sp. ES-W-0017-02]UDN47235.1 hypothetical protein JJJ25_17065 [Clostridioides sp. ES-S-0173-01]